MILVKLIGDQYDRERKHKTYMNLYSIELFDNY